VGNVLCLQTSMPVVANRVSFSNGLLVEEFTDYDSVVVFLAVARAYIAKFFVTSH